MCMSLSQLLLATHTQLSSQLLASINNAIYVYIVRIRIFIYTYVYIVQKRPSPPIPRTCHAQKVDTSMAIRRRFGNIMPKKSAIQRLQFKNHLS